MTTKNRFYTIHKPTGIFMMVNEDDKTIMLCNDCLKPSETKHGHVSNENDCEHAKEVRRMTNK